jgi:hypothetical protein
VRSKTSLTVTDRQVQALAQEWLSESLALKDGGWKCTVQVIWQVVMLAAARMISLFAACRDLANAPSDERVRQVLRKHLPKRPLTLEKRLEQALCGHLPPRLLRRARKIAIDYHLIPYHGQPQRYAKELYHSQPKSGTTKFHCYATACIVESGFRYTVAATFVWGKESPIKVLTRLLDRISAREIPLKTLLLDRQFFDSAVIAFLQAREIPFLMPLMMRGRKAKPGKRATGLRAFRKQPAGTYAFTWQVGKNKPTVTFKIVVAYKTFRHHRTKVRKKKKFLYAAWRVSGNSVTIRETYRQRFGIESSYRQLKQARIRTCTTDPVLRLFFVLVALVLRNVWVWLHFTYFAEEQNRPEPTMHLERLRFQRMLNWITHIVTLALHDGTQYRVELEP